MSRRVALPGADELFRSTAPAGQPEPEPENPPEPVTTAAATAPAAAPAPPPVAPVATPAFGGRAPERQQEPEEQEEPFAAPAVRRRPRPAGERRPTGRERHDEKITVYCSAEELLDLERARLTLRGDYGVAADRGRIVREALALVLADLEAKGEQSVLVRRLRAR